MLKNESLLVSFSFIKEHLKLSSPLILSALLSGSAQYVDGFIVTSRFDEATFAVFRYGARELPLVILLANAFSNAMLPEFSVSQNLNNSLQKIKANSGRMANFLFPLSAALLFLSHLLFPIIFNAQFIESASVFNVYLLLITSRLLFPQTVLIGLRKVSFIAKASLLELVINVALSLWFVQFWGIVGIAYATVLAYLAEKIFLVIAVNRQLNIPVTKYQNISVALDLFAIFVFHFLFS